MLTSAHPPVGTAQKICSRHLERIAIVYIRQSSLHQVQHNPESTRLQYSLRSRAGELGWAEDRILILDEDLGKSGTSVSGRQGFQRLLTEVALDHVGIILGAEMSRLARSNTAWHQLLELCARFGTLIADFDGLYDPSHYNDRLLLGLKGTMSEAELHILRQRLLYGKLQKARRGELGKPVPSGYLRNPSGEVVLDPDESVRAVLRFVFDQFDRIGTIHGVLRAMVAQGLQIGVRRRTGSDRGHLEWHRPHRGLLLDMLRNPIYAGAYVYGRRQADPRRQLPGRQATGRTSLVPPSAWQACVRDRLPAYISWEQYEQNQARLSANQSRSAAHAARDGAALLQGLVVCERCQLHMIVQYTMQRGRVYPRYVCNQAATRYGERICCSIAGVCLDRTVTTLVLAALTPAALEISLRVAADLDRQSAREELLWQQRLERAHYEAERAKRQYNSVEPEHRLVARTLEQTWEAALRAEQELREAYTRHAQHSPGSLTEKQGAEIRALALDLPALWHASSTTPADRRDVLRLLIDRVVVTASPDTAWTDVVVHWVGGHTSRQHIRRPVGKLTQIGEYDVLMTSIHTLRRKGFTSEQIAEQLNKEGWLTPTQRNCYNGRLVRAMLARHGSVPRGPVPPPPNVPHGWWLLDLARELKMPRPTLYGWMRRHWLKARRIHGRWVVIANATELRRLRRLRRRYASQCATPHTPSTNV